jgi:uncharacterized protein (DUF697 family)/predicted GTPase
MLERLKRWFSRTPKDAELHNQLQELRTRTPVPVFWLFGKTQSGKTSLIKYLTGADEAEIGHGFKPCTRYSRLYEFPNEETPLLTFLDTRGMDEPGYDPATDLAEFDSKAHVVIVTAKILDQAQENVIRHLERIRAARPSRPIVLALTCLHECYPQQQHPQPYPFAEGALPDGLPDTLVRSLEEQRRRFAEVVDHVVPLDLTRPEEGFHEPNYGGEHLKHVLLQVLPHAYRQTLLSLDVATQELEDLFARHALPHIVGYSSLAATAGAVPVPGLDLFILPAIQSQMISRLAKLYGQPMTGKRFLELASSLGIGLAMRTAARQLTKLIPVVGSVAGGALAGASTFALGKAFCRYYSVIHHGHIPNTDDLRRYYEEQLASAQRAWGVSKQQETRSKVV